ncbi:hypothetical protein [uncultured Draconibacterium sp.]|uniref:hypothetical protein n=1 Tax=uncultured Draconibacterium sp. TaxID=1573823 RepID=UPI0032165A34
MENKKLLKFLYKDIAEIEELFTDKGSEGFDEYEIEFIQSRFKGAKQVIQILSEKENKQLRNIRPRPVIKEDDDEVEILSVGDDVREKSPEQITKQEETAEAPIPNAEEQERLNTLSDFEEEVKESEQSQSQFSEKKVEESVQSQFEEEKEESEPTQFQAAEEVEAQIEPTPVEEETELEQSESNVELDEEEKETGNANHRLGDSFSKEKSVNELLAGDDSGKLEYKISNSPVSSLKSAIGINDRYQYIRELFEGNGDAFTKAVTDLDALNTIQEAVSYLQQNYKWKKNDTSLKFVNLVKRRFPNG